MVIILKLRRYNYNFSSGILPVNAHAEANILILNYINSFIL